MGLSIFSRVLPPKPFSLLGRILFAISWVACTSPLHAQIKSVLPQLPLYFETNRGQAGAAVKFLARGSGYTLYLTSTEATLSIQQGLIHISLLGANPAPVIEGRGLLDGKSNYFFGSDSTKWLTGVAQYSKVAYRRVYPGIDMIYEGDGAQLEYSFIVAPHADPDVIRMDFKGVHDLRLDPEGNLVLVFKEGGQAVFKAPTLFQGLGATRVPVSGRFVITPEKHVRFEVGDYDRAKTLIIDPTLLYSTYVGGTTVDRAFAIAVDGSGNTYIAGATTSNPFPGTAGGYQSSFGGGANDVFVTKINAAGTAIVWSTYLGGAGDDQANGIAVDAAGNVYLTGTTTALGFPVTALPFQAANAGGTDAFVTAVQADGTALIYSTYLGGAAIDGGNGIAVNALGTVYIAGHTDSANFPVSVGAFQSIAGGADDAFVASFSPGGARVYASFLGGTTYDHANAIAIDALGNAYLTGLTSNGTFPVTPVAPPASEAFYLTVTGPTDGFVAKVNPSGTTLLYATFMGGSGNDEGTAIAVGEPDVVYVTGFTDSADFPYLFTRVGQIALGAAAPDAFVFKLHMGNGGGFNDGVYATYLGGATDDVGLGIAVDSAGRAYVSGRTSSLDFPVTDPLLGQSTLGATGKAFITELNATGTAHLFSTYLGGGTDQAGQGIALDSQNNIYVAGWTNSANFPTAPVLPIQAANAGTFDAFSAKISAPTPPIDAPTGLAGVALGISSISWTWNAVSGAASYRLYQATSTSTQVGTTATLEFIETGLSSNTAYGRVVTAVAADESELSPSATTYTLAATPGPAVFTNVFYTSFTVIWAANNPAGTRFEVSRSTVNDGFTTAVTTPIAFADVFTSNTTNFVSLRPGTTYYVRIRAENGAVAGSGIATAFSVTTDTVTLTTDVPVNLSGTALGVSSIAWTWNSVPGATSYNLYQSTSPTTLITNVAAADFDEAGLTPNTSYGRVVTAVISGVESARSAPAAAYTFAATPGPGVFMNVFYTSFTVTWAVNNPAGTRFEVSRSTTNDGFATGVSTPMAFADSFTQGATTFAGLRVGTTYYLRIRAENGAVAGAGIPTAFSAVSSTMTLPTATPTNLTGSGTSVSAISWTWNAVPGAGEYHLYQATSTATLIVNMAATNFVETTLSTNTAYGRVVAAVDTGIESRLSDAATAYTWAAAPGPVAASEVAYTSFTVIWPANGNPGYTRYEVSVSSDNFTLYFSTPVPFGAFVGTTADLSNLRPGTTYFVRVRAQNNAPVPVMTAFAMVSTVTLSVESPSGLSGDALGVSSISWSWNAVSGASSYRIYQATSPATFVFSTAGAGGPETDLISNTAYGRVVSALINGVESALSPAATAYTLAAAPGAGVFTSVSSTSFTASWPANNPAGTRFEISFSTTNDNFATAVSTPVAFTDGFTTASYDASGLLPDTTYYFRIRSENGGTPGGGTLTAFSPGAQTFTLSPSAPAPAGSFSLSPARGTDAGGTEVVINGNGFTGATSVTFNGQNALSYVVDSDIRITARSPAQTAGPAVDVVVGRLTGGSALAGSYTFFAFSPPGSSGPGSYIFPSPASGPTATIVYTMAESGSVDIRVYNEIGDLVTKIRDSRPAGTQTSTLRTDWLAPGVYFYILHLNYDSGASDKRRLKKFVVKH